MEEEEEDQYLEQKALGNKPQKCVKCVNFRPNRGGDRWHWTLTMCVPTGVPRASTTCS